MMMSPSEPPVALLMTRHVPASALIEAVGLYSTSQSCSAQWRGALRMEAILNPGITHLVLAASEEAAWPRVDAGSGLLVVIVQVHAVVLAAAARQNEIHIWVLWLGDVHGGPCRRRERRLG